MATQHQQSVTRIKGNVTVERVAHSEQWRVLIDDSRHGFWGMGFGDTSREAYVAAIANAKERASHLQRDALTAAESNFAALEAIDKGMGS